MISIIGNIKDLNHLNKTIQEYKPDIVFHLAAQALVRYSYEHPIETYETNVLGTLKVFEACRKNGVKAIVNITSDKAYENKEQTVGYKENDPMGGYDPYSSSKGCAELLTSSYRNSYFNITAYKKSHHTLLASCRAGNVVGGGDWAEDRLISDIMISVSKNKKVLIRSPYSTRPWQHVLEPLSGYLHIGQKLLQEKSQYAQAWNFGPLDKDSISVKEVVEIVQKYWDEIHYEIEKTSTVLHEAKILKLDCTKAYKELGWENVWNSNTTFEKTVHWYKEFYKKNTITSKNNLLEYIVDAKNKGLVWAS